MSELSGAVSSMTALLLVTALGYLAACRGYLTPAVRGPLTRLILNISLPCMIVASAGQMDPDAGSAQIAWAFALAVAYFPVMAVAGAVCNLVLRPPRHQRHLYLFMSTATNTGFRLPSFASQTLQMAGGVTAPLAMMLVGLTIQETDLSTVLTRWRVYGFTVLRFLVLPAALYAALQLLLPASLMPDAQVLEIFIVLLAMPVASTGPLLATAYGQDPELPAQGTILSTLASFLIIPALIAVMALF